MILSVGPKDDPYAVAYQLFRILSRDMRSRQHLPKYLTKEELEGLLLYYSSWMRHSRYAGHYFAQRLKSCVQLIMNSHRNQPNILDCGCGFGSESIAFGLLGAKVLGVDLSTERMNVAQKRLNYYGDKYGIRVDVNFKSMNILDYDKEGLFDIIYAKEFITHMYSIPKFAEFANRVLKSSGYLIISDANPLNPFVRYEAWRVHRDRLYTVVRDPKTGVEVPYAVERLISPFYLKSVLAENQFKSTFHYYGFPRLPANLVSLIKIIESATSLPFLGTYEVVSTKT